MDLDFDSGDEDRLLRSSARSIGKELVQPFLDRHPAEPLPRPAILELLEMLRPLGIVGARLPAEAGGSGLTHVQLGILYEELPAEAAMIASVNDLAAFRLRLGLAGDVAQRFLPGLLAGQLLAASAISEPDTGSDLGGIRTRAERAGSGYRISGTKLWSSGALTADLFLVTARLDRDGGEPGAIGTFVVERDRPGIEVRLVKMLGLERQGIGEVVFDGCPVPGENLIGEGGGGTAVLAQSWLSQRATIGLIGVHLAAEALAASIAYARDRSQFGRPIGGFQLVQEMLVEMKTLVDTSRFLCYRALARLDAGRDARYESSVAKYYAAEAAVKVTNSAIQVHGALGLSQEAGLEKLYRDARMLPIPDGTTEIQKLIAGRELLGISAIRG
jgi:acyl-CoA dehydrogenase